MILTELERGEHLLRRKSIYESWHPETRQHVSGAHAANAVMGNATENFSVASFAADTAAKAGLTDRTIRQSIKRVRDIDEKVRDRIRDNPEIAGNEVDKRERPDSRPASLLATLAGANQR